MFIKIGPGPSSSHTIGPMKAAFHFRNLLLKLTQKKVNKATHFKILLYGSLSATGKGHGIERAVVSGLMGWQPADCKISEFLKIFKDKKSFYNIDINGTNIPLDYSSFDFGEIHHLFPYVNTMILQLKNREKVILEREYYSVGGGFIEYKGEPKKNIITPRYPYRNMNSLKKILKEKNMDLIDMLIENEMAISKLSKKDIFYKLSNILNVMIDAVDRGLNKKGVLPGPIKLHRKANVLYKKRDEKKNVFSKVFISLSAYALAASEENAAGDIVVTAPTSGAAGVIPALVYLLKNDFEIKEEQLIKGLITAAMIAFIAKRNASISGAEVGCQGEIGIATSMGAAFLSQVYGYDVDVIECAAEIALEHLLGLTCDPIKGYVQIPCIERNAIASNISYNAYVLASNYDIKKQKISFDQVIDVMLKTGRDICLKYKETSKGGLALCELKR